MAKKTTQSTAAANAVPQMDYPQHEATYQLFLGMVKWGIVSMAFVVLALYAFIEGHQPILGFLLLVLAVVVPIAGAVMGKSGKTSA
mgnify:CR=1 FL=1|jgi:hypothetical protein